jgi:glycine dehydrogenase subunit 1
MDFISNKEAQIKLMLEAIGIKEIEDLFSSIPEKIRIPKPSHDDGLCEYEGMRLMEALSAKNTYPQFENYLGAGAYEHHVPALVNAICSKSEFLTSYTPYQAEASQGLLQIIFEYQSAICALTGMDVSNASLYDGASACAEAVLMALRHRSDRSKILISRSFHPHYRSVVEQYLASHEYEIKEIPFTHDGRMDQAAFESILDTSTAAVLLQSPNFFGVVEEIKNFSDSAKKNGALTILCSNPLSYGLFSSAAELGVDIAVGDCQPLGLPLQFGGPYVGYMACKTDLIRQMPGRIVGETVDAKGRRGFVLTLQAREQHIRREKAASNICTNQTLAALASLVTILWYGKQGLKKLALTNFQRAAYLKSKLQRLPSLSTNPVICFNEFVLAFDKPMEHVMTHFRRHGIEPGLDLERYYPELKNHLLVAVTETKSKNQLDHYFATASTL